jgi:hypothetical protein
VGRGECPGAEEGRDVADGEAVQTQMTLLGNTDEPGFSANRRQATGMHVACYDSDSAELYIQANKFLRLQPCNLHAQESMCAQCMVAVSFVGYGMPLHNPVTA